MHYIKWVKTSWTDVIRQSRIQYIFFLLLDVRRKLGDEQDANTGGVLFASWIRNIFFFKFKQVNCFNDGDVKKNV